MIDTLYIELTHRCNLKCAFCYRDKVKESKDMSLEEFQDILKMAQSMNVEYVRFNGYGENILHKDFIKALKYARSQFGKVDFNTNGLALNDRIIDEIVKIDLDNIVFSVTGISDSVYNEFQGANLEKSGIREKVYNNILRFLEKRKKENSKIKIFMQYILTDKSKVDIINYINFWENKVDDIYVTSLNSVFDENNTKDLFNKKMLSAKKRKCWKIGNELLVHANGDISICCGDCFKMALIGNANNISLRDALNLDIFKEIALANDTLNFDKMPEACKKCDEVYENLFYDAPCKYSEIKKYICVVDQYKDKRLALLGINKNLSEFLNALNIFTDNKDYYIIDSFKEGIYKDKEILKPIKENLKGKEIIVFADRKFDEVKENILSIGLDCKSYKELIQES